jgi:hypothetical protein
MHACTSFKMIHCYVDDAQMTLAKSVPNMVRLQSAWYGLPHIMNTLILSVVTGPQFSFITIPFYFNDKFIITDDWKETVGPTTSGSCRASHTEQADGKF